MNGGSNKTLLLTWIALLILLAITAGSAFVPLGAANVMINFGIAALKALLVMIVFMDLRRTTRLVRMVAAAGFVWLLVLAGLSLTDYVTRAASGGW
jgi:cytochrome c oxidase subunit 4